MPVLMSVVTVLPHANPHPANHQTSKKKGAFSRGCRGGPFSLLKLIGRAARDALARGWGAGSNPFSSSPPAAGERGDSSKSLNDVGQGLSHLDSDACLKNPKTLLPPVLTAGLAACAGTRSPALQKEAS